MKRSSWRLKDRQFSGIRTLVTDLEDGPQHFVSFLALVGSILCVLHLITKFEEGVFDVVKAIRQGFAVTCGAYGWHAGLRPVAKIFDVPCELIILKYIHALPESSKVVVVKWDVVLIFLAQDFQPYDAGQAQLPPPIYLC